MVEITRSQYITVRGVRLLNHICLLTVVQIKVQFRCHASSMSNLTEEFYCSAAEAWFLKYETFDRNNFDKPSCATIL